MQLRYNFRLYPEPSQRTLLAKAFGCARVVFNDAMHVRREAHLTGVRLRDAEIPTRVITQAKRTQKRTWLSEVSSVVLVQAVGDAHVAYRNFFNSLNGRRKGPRLGAPRFRSRKDTRQAIRFTRNGFSLKPNGHLFLAKIGEIEVRWSRALPSCPSSVTVIRDSAGRYFASFVVELESAPLPSIETEIGIDLGLNAYAVDSKGRLIANPRIFRKYERRLRHAQRALSRKEKGSANRAKARLKVARAHARIKDTRRNWLHQETTRLIRENQAIYLENLAVAGLARTHLAKSVHDASWGSFRRMLEQKAAQYGRQIVIIDRFNPTSQVCSSCGHRDGPKPLQVRTWICPNCDAEHDRDHNAAKNILAAGRAERLNACGDGVRPGHALATVIEAGTTDEP